MTAQEARTALFLVPDEMPVFVLKGSDPCATTAILAWLDGARARGVNEEKLDSALNVLGEIARYQPKKLPD